MKPRLQSHDKRIAAVALLAGCRYSSVCDGRACDPDIDNMCIFIKNTLVICI